MTRSRSVIRTPVDRRCKVEGTVKTTLKVDFEINPIELKKKKKKKKSGWDRGWEAFFLPLGGIADSVGR
jgi:hypothetical protein